MRKLRLIEQCSFRAYALSCVPKPGLELAVGRGAASQVAGTAGTEEQGPLEETQWVRGLGRGSVWTSDPPIQKVLSA